MNENENELDATNSTGRNLLYRLHIVVAYVRNKEFHADGSAYLSSVALIYIITTMCLFGYTYVVCVCRPLSVSVSVLLW